MRISDLYAGSIQPEAAAPEAPANGNGKAPALAMAGNAVAISWLGVLIAVIALRLVYEFAE